MIHIGIDPGSRTGAYAIMLPEKTGRGMIVKPWDNDEFVHDIRDIATLVERTALSGENWKAKACVEKVGAMPKQGVSSTWVFAENYGYIQGVLHAFGIPFQLVPPRVWKKAYSLTSDKAKSIDVCHRLFPDISLKRSERCRTDDSNFAEAILIAEYGRRNL